MFYNCFKDDRDFGTKVTGFSETATVDRLTAAETYMSYSQFNQNPCDTNFRVLN